MPLPVTLGATRFTRTSCLVLLLFSFLLNGCQKLTQVAGLSGRDSAIENPGDEPEYGCSYFYFLWGRQAELGQRYEEAMEAYEKALICDPDASYIIHKMPILFLRMGQNEEAVAWLNRYLALYPDAVGSRMLLAEVLAQLSRFDEAAAQYRLIHSENPTDHGPLLSLAEMYFSQKKYLEAEQTLSEVLGDNQHSYGAHLLLGQIYRMLQQFEKSLQHYELALAENWSLELLMEIAELFLQQEDYDRALAQYDKVLSHEEDHEKARASKVHVYLLRKQDDEALEELSILREFSDTPGGVDLAVAKINISRGEMDKAISILREILEVKEEPEARFILGFLYGQQEKYQEALAELNRIPADSSSYLESIYLRIRIYRIQEKPEMAISLLEEAIEGEEGRSVDMYIMLAVLYQQHDSFDLARKTFSRGMAAYPDNHTLFYEFGLLLDSSGYPEEALEMMKKVLTMDPDHAAALNYVGYTWADHNVHLEKALEYISRAVALKPDNGYIRDSLGWIYFRLGRLEEARLELEKAIEISAEDPAIYEHLGDVYHQLGKIAEALEYYLKSIEFSSDVKAKEKVWEKIRFLKKLEKTK